MSIMNPHETNNQPAHKSSCFDSSKLISALALLISLAVGSFTVWNEINKEATTTRQSLTNILKQIIDMDQEVAMFRALTIPNEQKDFASFTFMNRKILLLRQAEELYKKLGEETTAEDVAIIAVAYAFVGDFENAESHMEVCLAKARTRIMRAFALRSFSTFAIARGDHPLATEFYDKALNEIGMPKNDVEINFAMSTILFKVLQSIARNDHDSAVTSLAAWVVKARDLPCTPVRGQWLERIADIVDRVVRLAPRLDVDVSALLKADGKTKCIYDLPRYVR